MGHPELRLTPSSGFLTREVHWDQWEGGAGTGPVMLIWARGWPKTSQNPTTSHRALSTRPWGHGKLLSSFEHLSSTQASCWRSTRPCSSFPSYCSFLKDFQNGTDTSLAENPAHLTEPARPSRVQAQTGVPCQGWEVRDTTPTQPNSHVPRRQPW